jgi:hypothetical protein
MEIREEDFRPSRDMRVGDTSKLGEWWVAWYELASKRLSLFLLSTVYIYFCCI